MVDARRNDEMAADLRERVIWLIGPQGAVLREAVPPPQQEVTRCFASLAELPSLDQVRLGEYPELLVLDVTAESEAVARIPELCRAWLTSVLALAPDYETAERCLLAGAGDVVVAPWTPAEVRLRARRLLHIPTGPLRAGNLVLNLATREVRTLPQPYAQPRVPLPYLVVVRGDANGPPRPHQHNQPFGPRDTDVE